MEITTIPYSETNYFSETVEKYLNQDEALKPFYSVFPSKENLLKLASAKVFDSEKREQLIQVLKEQNQNGIGSEQRENLELLKDEKTFTVTTGHQICLFGGPFYFFLKILSAIKTAKELNKNSEGIKFVPIYWMATEDHDFEEVNHVKLFGKKIEWNRAFGQHVGDMSLKSVESFKEELFEVLGDSQFAIELKTVFEEAYSQDKTFAEGTRAFVNHFFAQHGLLVLDANDKRLKSAFKDVMISDVQANSTKEIISKTNKELAKEIKIQANPGEVNLFYLGKEQRLKIKKEGDAFKIGDGLLDLAELKERIKAEPEKFSPNVLLRPLYQERVLPNIAYIGGGGELAYWLELEDLFKFHGLQFPGLVLRNSVLWIDKTSAKKMNSLGLELKDIFLREDDLVKAFSKNLLTENQNLNEHKERLRAILLDITSKMKELDSTLENSALGEQKNILKSIDKLESKILKSVKRKNEVQLGQVKKLKEKLFPESGLQERNENFAAIYLKSGIAFIDILLNKLDPFAFEFSIIKEES